MLKIKINHSLFNRKLKWCVDQSFAPGVCHHWLGPNGLGKSSLIEEIKLRWMDLNPRLKLGFVDQPLLAPFLDLTVEATMNIVWDLGAARRPCADWKQLPFWQEVKTLWPRLVQQLSGGENQWMKFLLMRSLDADVWILDEPFQSLDAKRQQEMTVLLQNWIDQNNYLILIHHGVVNLQPIKHWQFNSTEYGLNLMESP